jgi:uncharacterized protein
MAKVAPAGPGCDIGGMQQAAEPPEPAASAAVADGVSRALDPRWVDYQRQIGWLASVTFALMLMVAVVAGAALAELPPVPLAVAAAAAAVLRAWLSQWWPGVAYRYASYRLNERALEIRRGVLWRSVIDVPRSRIQHSDVSQGPLERLHGLGTLGVYTAGTSHALVQLHGLDHGRALAIREHLMQADEDDVV